MSILSAIIDQKQRRVETAKGSVSPEVLGLMARQARRAATPHALLHALKEEGRSNIIAEFKRRSPSKGEIRSGADPEGIAKAYELAGAAAVSVLTEEDYFDGSLDDLRVIRQAVSLPVLRKDFIFEEYQVYESAAAGADALLLIVAALDDGTLGRLRHLTENELGMDALVEVHNREEMDRAVSSGARLIGVNNRNLKTFAVSLDTSVELAAFAQNRVVLISESGIESAEDVHWLRKLGYRGFLIGETLMRAADPESTLRELVKEEGDSTDKRLVRVKICGFTNLHDARSAIDAGADMLGFNFYRLSPRFIEPAEARKIIEVVRGEGGAATTMVGVFVNESSPQALVRIVAEAGVDGVQLHGDESIDFCAATKELLNGKLLIKVLRVSGGFEPSAVQGYNADAIMLDAFHPEVRGGSGQVIDWAMARTARALVPRLFLAGGLSPENITQAIGRVRPFAVDACSSLEIMPGQKDTELVRAFVRAARNG